MTALDREQPGSGGRPAVLHGLHLWIALPEAQRAREDWVAGRFGQVHGYPGDPLAAPPLPGVPLKAR